MGIDVAAACKFGWHGPGCPWLTWQFGAELLYTGFYVIPSLPCYIVKSVPDYHFNLKESTR